MAAINTEGAKEEEKRTYNAANSDAACKAVVQNKHEKYKHTILSVIGNEVKLNKGQARANCDLDAEWLSVTC